MSWSNWIYLVIGMGLGVSSHWLFSRFKELGFKGALIDLPVGQLTTASNSSLNKDISSAQKNDEDISTLRAKLKQTQIAYNLAREMSQFKAGFLARTTHELRSPLSSLISLHQLILSDLCDNPDEERVFVAQAHSSALKLMSRIDEILEVSRLEHGTIGLEIQPLQLATLLTKVYNLTHLIATNRNIHLQLAQSATEIYVLADPRWLQQVLLNLLSTCLSQMQGGDIFISSQTTPANNSAQILLNVDLPIHTWVEPVDLIQSEQQSTEPVIKHTSVSPGMSLLLVQTILEVMQGHLDISSSPTAADDSYTVLQVTIPLVILEAALEEQQGS